MLMVNFYNCRLALTNEAFCSGDGQTSEEFGIILEDATESYILAAR